MFTGRRIKSENIYAEMTRTQGICMAYPSDSAHRRAMHNLGNIIRERRKLRGLTLDQLASEIGCTKGYLSIVETGKRLPSQPLLRRLEEALGIEADALQRAGLWHATPSPVRAQLDALRRENATARELARALKAGNLDALHASGELRSLVERLDPAPAATPPGHDIPDNPHHTSTNPHHPSNNPCHPSHRADPDAAAPPGDAREHSGASAPAGRPDEPPIGSGSGSGDDGDLPAAYLEPCASSASEPGECALDDGGPAPPGIAPPPPGAGPPPAGIGPPIAPLGDPFARAHAAGSAALVPVVNSVQAGYPREFTDLGYPARVADDYVAVPGITDPDAFAARVVGDSMEPAYIEGDIVIFSPLVDATDGTDCFVRLVRDDETTFKRVFVDFSGDFGGFSASDSAGGGAPGSGPAGDGVVASSGARPGGDADAGASVPAGLTGPGSGECGGEEGARLEGVGDGADAPAGRIRLQPLNARYAPRVVDRAEIGGMYRAVCVIRRVGAPPAGGVG